MRRLLLRNGFHLHPGQRFLLNRWLQLHPELNEVYRVKEALRVGGDSPLQHLEGDTDAEHDVGRLVDGAHAAAGNAAKDGEAAGELLTRRQRRLAVWPAPWVQRHQIRGNGHRGCSGCSILADRTP